MRSNRRGGFAAVAVVLVALLGVLTGCSLTGSGPEDDTPRTGAVSVVEQQELLDARSAAVLDGDLAAFMRTLDPTDRALRVRQRRYFTNMQALPVRMLRYTVLKSDWPSGLRARRWDRDVSVPQVRVETQLADFDEVPVVRITGFAFTRRNDRPVIVSELTGAGRQFPGSSPAPWDLVRLQVRTDGQTLQLYDDLTAPDSDEIMSTVRRGIADVQDALPFSWDGRVVVYVFARKVVLNSFEGVPGGNINHLGAMTFPMYAELGRPTVAGIRFTLLPSSVRAGQPFLGRITRHELTHVAVGDRDDGVPIWFAEGLAEYLGARPIPENQRRIATVAVTRARQGVEGMPASSVFNGKDQAWNYALSWMACDYIAATQGEPRLWQLMDALHDSGDGTPDEEQDAVLEQVLGFGSSQLAHRAARRILRIYG